MALSALTQLLVNQADTLVPHIEEAALKYTMRRYVMAQRVQVYGDMSGWNVRKISEYLRPRRAQSLSEDTAIPATQMARIRKTEIEPAEVGDRHRISDRRATTDLENIVGDTIEALGQSIGDRKEADLMQKALDTFSGGNIDGTGADYNINYAIDAQFEFAKRARRGTLYHVIHPFQARDVMKDLVAFGSAGVDLDFRERAIAGWNVPAFNGLNIAISEFLPRKVVHLVSVGAAGGTFRLQVGVGHTIGENITAAISWDATDATLATNIQTALNALDMSGFYSGSGSWAVADNADETYTVTPPSDLYLDAEQELRVAVDYESDPTLDGQKSAYDLLTTPTLAVDVNGVARGVIVDEVSATAKSLLFYPQALVLDVRAPLAAHFELVNQGRTAEYSAYETYGVGGWRTELGMTIETDATSAFAVV